MIVHIVHRMSISNIISLYHCQGKTPHVFMFQHCQLSWSRGSRRCSMRSSMPWDLWPPSEFVWGPDGLQTPGLEAVFTSSGWKNIYSCNMEKKWKNQDLFVGEFIDGGTWWNQLLVSISGKVWPNNTANVCPYSMAPKVLRHAQIPA